ncbi:hypothetical protein [Thermoflexus hugenholtzii]
MGKIRALWHHYPWGILGVVALFVLSGDLAASAAWEMISEGSIRGIYSLYLFVFVFIMFISALILYNFRHRFLRIHSYMRKGNPGARRGILLFLSKPNRPVKINLSSNKLVLSEGDNYLEINKGEQLADFVSRLADSWLRGWNWVQIFRGLIPHATWLEYIFVIYSEESMKFKDDIETLLSLFLYNKAEIIVDGSYDFNIVDSVRDGLRKGVQEGLQRGLQKKDLVIDITGGTKLTSIAGTLYGVEEGILLQYVSTMEPYDLIYYDIFPKLLEFSH